VIDFVAGGLGEQMMHDFIIFLAFIGILLAPAIVAANSDDMSDGDK
jgi:hypothetical protein